MGGPGAATRGVINWQRGTVGQVIDAIKEKCPGLEFDVVQKDQKVGLLTVTVGPRHKLGAQFLLSLHRALREVLPAGVDYEIETNVGTFTSRNTKKEETSIPARGVKRDKNRTRNGAPWGF